jgi:hypothetical protein
VLTPSIAVHGKAGGSQVDDTFAPTPLTFVLDGTSLRVQETPVATTPGAAPADPMHPSQPGVVPHRVPASIKLAVVRVHATTARTLGLVGLVLAGLLALLGLALRGRDADDELVSIRRQSAGMLVPVSSPLAAPPGGYVDVAHFDSLVHIARNYQLMILHHQRGDAHSFFIDDDGSIYRYTVRAA